MYNNDCWGIGDDVHIQGLHFSHKSCMQFQGYFDFLTINGHIVPDILINKPFIYTNTCLYLAVYINHIVSFSEKGHHRICRLHVLDNCRIEYIGIPQQYIELIELRHNRLFYYDHKRTVRYADLNDPVKSSEADTPVNFSPVIKSNSFTLEYVELEKISPMNQLAGCLKINGCLFSKHKFGGPCLYNESYLFIPVLKRKIWKIGFNLARIDLSNERVHIFPVFKKMIFLESFKDDTVCYYEDINKTIFHHYGFEKNRK